MILNTAPQNEAVLSNVGEIGEFRIRNSAKAFNILSSGLYANKIRAIIRELSCNAVDSHVAAGRGVVAFDVHLPNALEPHFSIRDYGTGLTHDQVTNIYTTYFESTKTTSNEFIGALGLGSKSPFSYTDNFTVTAIKDGRKGIYSAFINGEGVPSIALMMSEDTDEPAGVEIKFSVNDRYDFSKFRDEARNVYRYFTLKPNVSGADSFEFKDVLYETKDIIPGVSLLKDAHASVAVMGNIAYPIDVPNERETLGDLADMLECGIEIRFNIGEVDFQASREGLSYIPQTIEAIKNKLILLRDALTARLTAEADAIDNEWQRAVYLWSKVDYRLWHDAVSQYVIATKLRTVDKPSHRWHFLKKFAINVSDLASKYNIEVRSFSHGHGQKTCPMNKVSTEYTYNGANRTATEYWEFPVANNTHFIINDGKIGCTERARFHYRHNDLSAYVYVLEKVDATQEMNTEEFFKELANPPATQIILASALDMKPRASSGVGRNVTILTLERGSSRSRSGTDDHVWVSAGDLSSFAASETRYYVPLSGFKMIGETEDAKELQTTLKTCGIPALSVIKLYGVRKADLKAVQSESNWVNVEEFIKTTLTQPSENIMMHLAMQTADVPSFMNDTWRRTHYRDAIGIAANPDSPYNIVSKMIASYKKIESHKFYAESFMTLYKMYAPSLDIQSKVSALTAEINYLSERYPLLKLIDRRSDNFPTAAVAEYINFIDTSKGI